MRFSILLFTLIIHAYSFAQVKHNFIRTHGFYRENIPGVLMVDDAGNAVPASGDTTFFMYLETKSRSRPSIDTLYYGSNTFSVDVVLVTSLPAMPGRRKDNNQLLKLRPAKGNGLWLLQCNLISKKGTYRSALLSGVENGKRFYRPVARFIGLQSAERG